MIQSANQSLRFLPFAQYQDVPIEQHHQNQQMLSMFHELYSSLNCELMIPHHYFAGYNETVNVSYKTPDISAEYHLMIHHPPLLPQSPDNA